MGSTSSEIAPGQFVKHVRAGTHAVLTIPTGLLPTDDEVIGVKVTRIDRHEGGIEDAYSGRPPR